MDRDETLATLDEIEQRLFLVGRDPRGVGVDDQSVVAAKDRGVESVRFVRVGDVDAALGQNRLKLAEALGRAMMAVVAEEEDLDRLSRIIGDGRRAENA